MMKPDFLALDRSIIEALAKRPLRLEELLEVTVVRDEALRLNVRRAGVPPSESSDTTVKERMQALRLAAGLHTIERRVVGKFCNSPRVSLSERALISHDRA